MLGDVGARAMELFGLLLVIPDDGVWEISLSARVEFRVIEALGRPGQ